MRDRERRARRTAIKWAVVATGGVLAIGGGMWSGSVLFAAPPAQRSDAGYTTAIATHGEVGSKIRLSAVARWERSATTLNRAAGTVTSVDIAAGDTVDTGTVVYSVDLRPVVMAVGTTPAFRPLQRGDEGPDVRQLVGLLSSLGYYSGGADDKFGERAERAVKAYQRAKGMTVDGVVALGDVIFAPALPARAALETQALSVGVTVNGGEAVLALLSPEPTVTIPVSSSQAASVKVGADVVVEGSATGWHGSIADVIPSADENAKEVNLVVTGQAGRPICGGDCETIPVGKESTYPAEVILQPVTAGVVIPTAAIRSGSKGEIFVIDEKGMHRSVEVVASADGMSAVEGIAAGSRVRLSISEKAVEP